MEGYNGYSSECTAPFLKKRSDFKISFAYCGHKLNNLLAQKYKKKLIIPIRCASNCIKEQFKLENARNLC